jgi:hypothetical protein
LPPLREMRRRTLALLALALAALAPRRAAGAGVWGLTEVYEARAHASVKAA